MNQNLLLFNQKLEGNYSVFNPWSMARLSRRWIGLVLLVVILLLVPKPLVLAQDVLLGLTTFNGAQAGGTAFSIKSTGADFTVHKNFDVGITHPAENLIQGTDGNFYGMTQGAIFKMSPSGTVTTMHRFEYNNPNDGTAAKGSLVEGADGNFYGMTSLGGLYGHGGCCSFGYGVIFKITPSGSYTILRHLNYSDGTDPKGSLVKGSDGNFFGMTYSGGTYGAGTIFKISGNGAFTVLHNFDFNNGYHPLGNLVQGSDGVFYGMVQQGGTNNGGTIFKITASGTFTVLRHLNPTTDGSEPKGSLVQGKDGYFYGMTFRGGTSNAGTIFKITPGGSFTVLRHLNDTDGGAPHGDLVQGSDGSFYGMTNSGGMNSGGTIFKITPAGTFTVLRHLSFNTTDGRSPEGSLVQGTDGNFYGMSEFGGTGYGGSIFKITSTGGYSILVSFPEASKNSHPYGSLIQATDGNFYGMTRQGGAFNTGTIFKMCNNSFSVLKSFGSTENSTTGYFPEGNLVQGTDGNFYGMTAGGEPYGSSIFKITPTGTMTVLRHLQKNTDGINPSGSLIQGTDGNFYGMTRQGGTNRGGTIFKITSTGTFTILVNLDLLTTGATPLGSLIQGSDGNFYGMTSINRYYGDPGNGGTIFKMTPSGTLTVLKHLNPETDGGNPKGSLVQGTDGNFYGMTQYGGGNNVGTVFRITPNGSFSVLRSLNSTTDGGIPKGDLVQGYDGSLYGMTSEGGKYGGPYKGGTIFKITTSGLFTVLRHLNPETDGSNPYGSLIIQKANPVAQAQNITTPAGTAKAITLTATAPGTPLTYTIVSQPKNGTLSGSGANRTYTPQAGFSGTDAFTFTATWGCQVSKVQTVSITVTGNTSSLTLAPVADAYVRNGTYAATNYGSAASLFVKGTTGSGYARTSYLKFSLINVAGVSSAKLRVYGNNTENTTAINLSVYGLSNDVWTENGITWNNAPLASNAALSTVGVNNQAQYYELDVTSFVQAQLAGDKTASLLLKDAANQNRSLVFNSKENAANPPQLVIQTANPIRLNSGGNAIATSMGNFSADTYLTGTTGTYTNAVAIANTTDDALYQDYRRVATAGTSFGYSIPVSNGTYTVKLHFAEIFHSATGKRKFNVTAEGITWLSGYDIFAAAGGANRAIVVSRNITVTDGQVDLTFASVVDRACVAAVEVLPATTAARLANNLEPAATSQLVHLYPNPAQEKITIKLTEPATQVASRITDVTGAKYRSNTHRQVDDNTLEIPVAALPPAIFLLHLQTEHGQQILKFVKQ